MVEHARVLVGAAALEHRLQLDVVQLVARPHRLVSGRLFNCVSGVGPVIQPHRQV